MSSWHRQNPHLTGTGADPWMSIEGYRKSMATTDLECPECGDWTRLTDDGLCHRCTFGAAP